MKKLFIITLLGFICSCNIENTHDAKIKIADNPNHSIEDYTIINLYDAFGKNKKGLVKDFGFSCILKYKGNTILFDAGSHAEIFKNNVEALGIDLKQIDFVIASHAHFDHINGLDYLLKINPKVKIYFPFDMFWGANVPFNLTGQDSTVIDSLDKKMQYFDGNFQSFKFNQSGRFWKANIEFVKENMEIAPGIKLIATSSPYMGYFSKYPNMDKGNSKENHLNDIKLQNLNELSLSLKRDDGEVLIVGCSHSSIERIIMDTKEYSHNNVDLIYGGYHLLPYDRSELMGLSDRLKNTHHIKKVAPAHCTGHLAFKILQDEYKSNYIFAGLGEIIKF